MRSIASLPFLVLVACGSVGDKPDPDAPMHAIDAPMSTVDAPPDGPSLGSMLNPATGCVQLKNAGAVSGVYFLKDANNTVFETYCEQTRDGGGWALVYRSVFSASGATNAFWMIPYAERFDNKGDPHPGMNFYSGHVYKLGRDYEDLITDLQNKTVVAFVASTSGIAESTMQFQSPVLTSGDSEVYGSQFAAGWSSSDHDGDTLTSGNCTQYGGGTQHYTACFVYALGADGESPYDDGGVGPHVKDTALTALQLALQPNTTGTYSRVNAIERWARW
jgi:hypothetical protein